MSAILADLGGTHLRLAYAKTPDQISKFKIQDYPSLEHVLQAYAPDCSALYLASAITPLNDLIEDKRFSAETHWRIDLKDLRKKMKIVVLNDLEAAAHGLAALTEKDMSVLLPTTSAQTQFDHPPKVLIGIGTGIGHAYLFQKPGLKPFVQRTHGGHIVAFGLTEEHHKIIALMQSHNKLDRDLIIENIVSGNGLWTLQDLIGKKDAVRIFWEFLGLYCNTIATLAGAYGGIYLTGGIMEDMEDEGAIDIDSFAKYFRRPLVASVVESISATAVYDCHTVNLAILGLSEYSKAHP